MKSKSLSTILLLLIICTVNGQDLIYTVRGEYNSNPLSLDSILVENLSNSTRLLFGHLPIQPDYKINLSSGEQEGPTSFQEHQLEDPLAVVRNLPGNLTLALRSTKLNHARISVYNTQGQMLWVNPELSIRSGQLIDVNSELSKFAFLKILNRKSIFQN